MISDWRLATAVKLVATAMKVMRVGDINAFPRSGLGGMGDAELEEPGDRSGRPREELEWRESPIGGLLRIA
jgi:hypothetical protein